MIYQLNKYCLVFFLLIDLEIKKMVAKEVLLKFFAVYIEGYVNIFCSYEMCFRLSLNYIY